jgi:heme-degrading monooxygenase HmoA
MISTFTLKPGADAEKLKEVSKQISKRFLSIPGCLESKILVGTQVAQVDDDHFDNRHVGQYAQLVIWENQEALEAWVRDPKELLSQELKTQFEEIADFGFANAYTEIG